MEVTIVRAAVVQISHESGKVNIKRPVTKLYPLEINANFTVTENEKLLSVYETDEVDYEKSYETHTRPTRVAADTGILIRRIAKQC